MKKSSTKKSSFKKQLTNGFKAVKLSKNLYGRIEDIKDSLTGIKDDISDTTQDMFLNARTESSHLKKKVTRYVAKKPYQSLGIALVSCFCIGYLMRSKQPKQTYFN